MIAFWKRAGLGARPAWLGPLLALVFVYLLFVILSPDTFARPANLITMARQTAVVGIAAVLLHFPPGARWNLPTFGIAFLPGLALATLLSGMGRRGG